MLLEIQSLSEEVQRLSGGYGWWSKASQILIGATAVVTVLYFISSGIALRRANALQDAQNRFGKVKDDQLSHDLKAKDQKIAEANAEAGRANKSASEANERASKADERAALADERAGKANERAGELEKQAADARLQQERLREQNLATEVRLGKEQDKRLDLERSLAPRNLPLVINGNSSNIDSLRPLAGLLVQLEYLPETEPMRATRQIAFMLENAGWKIEPKSNPELWHDSDGVTITWGRAGAGLPIKAGTAAAGAENLRKFLTDNGWQGVRAFPSSIRDALPANTIKVQVGFKPDSYFSEKLRKDWEGSLKRERPRKLDPQQKSVAQAWLARIPKTPVQFACPEGNKEACDLATELRELFKSAGWEVDKEIKQMNPTFLPVGITVLGHNDVPVEQPFRDVATSSAEIVRALTGCFPHLEVEVDRRSEMAPPFIGIWVGVATPKAEQ